MMMHRINRRGVALYYAVVILAMLSIVGGLAAVQMVRTRLQLVGRQNLLQARWLDRAGVELAIAQAAVGKADAISYSAITDGHVKVTMEKAGDDRFHATCESVYPLDDDRAARLKTTHTIAKRDGRWRVVE